MKVEVVSFSKFVRLYKTRIPTHFRNNLPKVSRFRALAKSYGNLDNLKDLTLTCAGESLPDSIGNMGSLEFLEIDETGEQNFHFCTGGTHWKPCVFSSTHPSIHLRHVPESIGHLQNLERLSFRGCSELTSLPESIGNLRKLKSLDLRGCTGLRRLPDCVTLGMPNLEELRVDERLLENRNLGDDFMMERIRNLIIAGKNSERWEKDQLKNAISLGGNLLFRR